MNSLDLAAKEFRRYSLKHEAITYAIMPPLAVYFAIVIGNYTGDKLYFSFFVGFGLFAAPMSCILSLIIRTFLLKPLLIQFFDFEILDSSEKTNLKSDLLKYPFREGIINSIRWTVGPLFFLAGNSLGMQLDTVNIITPLTIIVYMIPLSFISGFVLAEMDLSKLIESEKLINVSIDKERSGNFPQIYRFFFSLFAVSWIPLIVLSYIILLIHNGILNFPNLNIHLPILVSLFLINIIIYTFILSKPIDIHLKTISKGITSLSNGQITLIPIISNDEFGKLNAHFNALNEILKKSFDAINRQSIELLTDSQKMKEYSEILANSSNTQTLNTRQLSDISSEMDQVSNTISNSSTDQTSQSKESEKVILEMESSIEKISLSMLEASHISGKTFLLSEEGLTVVNTALAQIQKIQENTKSISGVIELISDISDQINLLSLNASIEAARAGEAGKGFKVVAAEVSKLAEHTQKNVKEIAKSIKEAVKSANAGFETIHNTSHKFEEIQKNIKITVRKIDEISENVKGQKDLGQRVEESFSVIQQLSLKINREIETERVFSEKLTSSVLEIKDSTQLAKETIHNLETISATLADRSKLLTNQIQFFKLSLSG